METPNLSEAEKKKKTEKKKKKPRKLQATLFKPNARKSG